jgi:WD40 repeat protein
MKNPRSKKSQSLVVLSILIFFSVNLYNDVIASEWVAYGTWNEAFYSLDIETATGTKIPCSVTHLQLAFAPDGTLYATSRKTDSLYRFIDPSAGTLEYLAPLPVNCTGGDTTVSPDGKAVYFTLGWQSPDLFKYDIDVGNIVSLGPITGVDDDIYGLAFSPEGVLYGTTGTNTGDKILYTIDLSSMKATAVGPPFFGLNIELESTTGSLDFAPDGTLYAGIDPTRDYLSPDVYLSIIDTQTGIGTIYYDKRLIVNGSYYYLDSIAIIPEPTTLILFGFGGLSLLRKRRL